MISFLKKDHFLTFFIIPFIKHPIRGEKNMQVNERREEILELLKQKHKISIPDLAELLQVSEITVRRDLDLLDHNNQIVRIRGGAKWLDDEKIEKNTNFLNSRFQKQAAVNQEKKVSIGKLAASLVHEDDTILIDAGSTALEFAKQLKGKSGITAVVTAVNIAEELEGIEGINTILSGGAFRSRTTTLINPFMDRMLMQIYADKVFLGISALSIEKGFSGNDILEAQVKQQLLESGKQIYWLLDSSKVGKISTIRISPIREEHTIITDDRIDPVVKTQLENKCNVLLAKIGGGS
jgi:DeoR/GlpR family transcriptional regulator of sugar metabolism